MLAHDVMLSPDRPARLYIAQMRNDLLGAAIAFIVVFWLLAIVIKRWLPRLSTVLRVAASLVGRVAVGAVFITIAVGAIRRGGWWWLLAGSFSALALMSLGLAALTLFALVDSIRGSQGGQAS